MPNNNILAEALARIEHKLDLLLESQASQHPNLLLTPVGDGEHTCPLCLKPVHYQVDFMNALIKRLCGCSTGLQAPVDLNIQIATEPPKHGQED